MNKTQLLQRAADNIRILAVSAVENAKSGHPGGAMGGADFINMLYSEFLVYDPENPEWEGRDRFFLDPGHMAPMLYSQLCLAGFFTVEELKQLRRWGSPTPGHPELCVKRGIENTSGPLGQGHVFAVGAAIAAKFVQQRFETHNPTIYAYISDGGVQEEISQGAGRIAGHLGLNNLIMFYDANDIQLSTTVSEVTSEDVAKKYEAWGWYVQTIDGNDPIEIRVALNNAKAEQQRPSLIIGKTIMGKGALTADGTSFEGKCQTHGTPIGKSGASFEKTIENLGGNPDNPFVIFPEVQELYDKRREELRDIVNDRYAQLYDWKKKNPALADTYDRWFSGDAPIVDWSKIEQKAGAATRSASATVLAQLAQQVDNMIVSSADLSNSDKTDGFLKHTHAITRNDFSGAFLQAGVSELTMACLCIGMTLHGGVSTACATFFVFSDYMKPAMRLAALMELPVKFIFSHDSFRVGEDGPTHEPIEQEMQIRLMERLHNHSGKPSMLVLRPADAEETTLAWRLAMENISTPSVIILSRQDIVPLPKPTFEQVCKGAYIVSKDDNPQLVLIASGSDVSTLQQAADILREEGIHLQVVSVPSEGLFRQQPEEYQQQVLPQGVKRFGLTSGLSCTLESLVGTNGHIHGLDSFGFSAPYKVIEEKLGYTVESIVKQIKEIL